MPGPIRSSRRARYRVEDNVPSKIRMNSGLIILSQGGGVWPALDKQTKKILITTNRRRQMVKLPVSSTRAPGEDLSLRPSWPSRCAMQPQFLREKLPTV